MLREGKLIDQIGQRKELETVSTANPVRREKYINKNKRKY
jgi:hypothetical protein